LGGAAGELEDESEEAMDAGIGEAAAGGGQQGSIGSRRATIAVVIPAYNEQDAVRGTVESVRYALDRAQCAHEIIVVDDGSSDNTMVEARASGAHVISFADNRGYGHALKAGIAASDSDLVAILDADGTYPPDALPAMVRLAESSDMVVGDRGPGMKNVPLVRRPAKWVLQALASVLARRRIDDVNSGLRVFRRQALEQFIALLPDGYSFTTTITLCMLASSLRVVYHPINYGRRIGHSKIKARHFFSFLFLVLRLTVLFRPLRIFLPAGALLFIAGAVIALRDGSLGQPSVAAVLAIAGAVAVWSVGLWAEASARLRMRRRPTDRPQGSGPA
jgi:glycosyltransferase involved in cell wall biosynthesis